jgi:hypothetical protein
MLLITSRKIMKYEFAGNAHRSASWMRDGGGGGGGGGGGAPDMTSEYISSSISSGLPI